MDFATEVWKTIKGYGGRYQISNMGRIWNTVTQRLMKPQLKKTGYYNINLMKPNKKIVTERVHRLVALYFCPKKEGCNVVNHIDCNKTNNRWDNLEWTTVSGNTKHCYDNSQSFRNQVARNSKLGAEKIILTLEVWTLSGDFVGQFHGYKEAAEALGINEKTVRNIRFKKFKTNRNGYVITATEKGGETL